MVLETSAGKGLSFEDPRTGVGGSADTVEREHFKENWGNGFCCFRGVNWWGFVVVGFGRKREGRGKLVVRDWVWRCICDLCERGQLGFRNSRT